MPEQLALEQVLGDRGAVDGDEGSGCHRPVQMHSARHDLLPGARLALYEHGRRARRDPRDQLVDLEHRGALPHEGVLTHGVGLDVRQGHRGFGGGTHAAQGAQKIVPAHRKGQHVQDAEFFGAQHQPHRGPVRHRDQARRGSGAAQRIHPPGEILVGAFAEHGDHDVPPPGTELPHGAWEIRDGLDLGAALTHPLADALEQAPAAAALGTHGEDPQLLPPLLVLQGGRRSRQLRRHHSGHGLARPSPR